MKPIVKTILWLTAFSIAMGYLECAVVVYLRELYYPEGFKFPLTFIPPNIAVTEFVREIATLIMLLGIGILTGKSNIEKFAFFIYCFAIWDIFYYVFLKVILGWPETIFDWDILFLIPVPWVGPVLAPVIVSLTMILLAFVIVCFDQKNCPSKFLFKEKLFLISGCLILVSSFIRDYLRYVYTENSTNKLWTLSSKESLFSEVANYVPRDYNWTIFWTGEIILLLAIGFYFLRMRRSRPYV